MVPKVAIREFLDEKRAELVLVHDGGMNPRKERKEERYLHNAFMASASKHPVLKRAMDIEWEHYEKHLLAPAVLCTDLMM
jgi:hypothetical protein